MCLGECDSNQQLQRAIYLPELETLKPIALYKYDIQDRNSNGKSADFDQNETKVYPNNCKSGRHNMEGATTHSRLRAALTDWLMTLEK